MQKITIDDAIEIISSEIKKAPFQRTEASVKKLFDLRLAAVAKTHLLDAPETYGLELEVAANSSAGEVTVFKNPTLADDPEMTNLFLGLAREEARHKLRFEVEYDEAILQGN